MKNKLSVFSVLSIATLLLSTIGIAFAPVSIPHASDAMWVDNPAFAFTTATTPVGFKFNVTLALNVSTSTTYFAWQATLDYPGSWLNISKSGLTAGLTSEFFAGHTSVAPTFVDSGTNIKGGESLIGADVAVGKAATLMWIEFNITKAPPKGTNFTGLFDLSTEYAGGNVYVLDVNQNNVALTIYDDAISYTWSPPTTMPFMGIEGPSAWPLTYGPGAAIGDTFDAKVYVKQIDPNWFLHNVTFTLTWNDTVIDTLGGLLNVTIDPAWVNVTDSDSLGIFSFFGDFNGIAPPLANKVLVATLHFTVLTQQTAPPSPAGAFDESYLTFSGVVFWDHTLPITAAAPEQGHVIVGAFVVLKLPYLAVDPAVTIVGPGPSIGSTVYIKVDVYNLTQAWNTVGIQFRLQYDLSVLSLVSVTEGPFMTNPTWDLYGTFPFSLDNPTGDLTYPGIPHVIFADLLFPNTGTGIYDQTPLPNAPITPTPETPGVNDTVAIFGFKVLQQNCFGGANITTALNILPFWPVHDQNFIDKDGNYIDDQGTVNGTVIIEGIDFSGRVIDMYGGAVNDGYGVLVGAPYLQFPAPFGGQGPNVPMDLVFAQSWVYLHANVTYNYWPVQNKDVGFEIEGPFIHLPNGSYVPAPTYRILAKFTATSDVNGVASYAFRMPWPCVDDLTGVWKVTSTVTIADQVVMDTMMFYYQHQAYIFGVTTDMYSYYHDQCVKVTVDYSTHSIQSYPVLFAVVITDDLGVPFGMALYNTTVGGAVFCTWKNDTFTVTICIPKWAYAGNGYVHVSIYDKDPTIGGEAIGPEFTPDPQINIYPY